MSDEDHQLCPQCSLPIDAYSPGAAFKTCTRTFHLACLKGKTRDSMQCGNCAKPPESRLSLNLPTLGLESTSTGGGTSETARLQLQLDEMRNMMVALQASISSIARETIGTGSTASAERTKERLQDGVTARRVGLVQRTIHRPQQDSGRYLSLHPHHPGV